MSKIVNIKIENFKAIEHLEANFKGCTAIVTGGNNKGKTSFLRGIPDRIRFVRPEVMVKQGSTKGKGEMTLDTGERFIWEFATDGTDKLQYISTEGAKRTVTVDLGAKFFPKPFDIDKFLNSTPKEQSKQLQKILNVDFADIDKRYADAFAYRTDKNREAEKFHVKLTEMMEVPKVLPVDLTELQAKKETERTRLNTLYTDNKKANDEARRLWQVECDKVRGACEAHNSKMGNIDRTIIDCDKAFQILEGAGYEGEEVTKFIQFLSKTKQPLQVVSEHLPKEPEYITEKPDSATLDAIDAEILDAVTINKDAQAYIDYVNYKQSVETAKELAQQADEAVKAIESERQAMIESVKLPAGLQFTSDGLTVDGLPLDNTQISTSKKYIYALKIGAINLGEVKSLFFDASYLDNISLKEVMLWAESEGLQLLIERPDMDGGEITYNLIEN